ncbi:hypothetical protein L6164_008658 [Bauhinia variegata]|uniref:Uncharacterized protein n=1 Tax=Bauhinia variegata TaxID=167791 RepID=A0ACB9PIJ7_BAUVA|nr:hypothetical protein L6164_008658 [Bauhinia variegata]
MAPPAAASFPSESDDHSLVFTVRRLEPELIGPAKPTPREYLQPPFPCFEDLLFDVPGSAGVLHSPLLLVQVTRLKCGGFIFGLRLNHTMSDAAGLVQFMNALGEIARGADEPSIPPVWCRELLNARDPPQVTCVHREYEQVPDTKGTIIPLDDMAHRSFFFGPTEIAAVRRFIPHHLSQSSSAFEILTALLWRCRTLALQPDSDEEYQTFLYMEELMAQHPSSDKRPVNAYWGWLQCCYWGIKSGIVRKFIACSRRRSMEIPNEWSKWEEWCNVIN